MKIIKADMFWEGKAKLGEGPFWDELEQALYWVDIDGYKLHSQQIDHGAHKALPFAQHVTAFVNKEGGGSVLALRDGLYTYYKDRLTPFFILPDKGETVRFNDAKCDPLGRLWAGTMAFDGASAAGVLYVLDEDGQVTEMVDGLTISNGMAWDTSRHLFYHNETTSGLTTVYRYDKSDTKKITHVGSVPINYKGYGGAPDGMTIDDEGMLWVALWGAGAVIRVNPDTGAVSEKITVPASHTTSCTFGGEGYRTLYITTAHKEREERSGAVYAARLDVAGAKSIAYRDQTT